jgi:signal transduction histidine kinase
MEIRLVSGDSELFALCREVLSEIPGRASTLSTAPPENVRPGADLYIWDFDPEFPIPDQILQSGSTHLFLIDRKDLSDFPVNMVHAGPMILLKPLTRATLSSFLGLALSSRATNSLQASRDEIFQSLIQTNLKLQEYEQDRTNFLARATHDFRAPLTALSGYCGLLLGGAIDPASGRQTEVLKRMQQSLSRLSRLAEAMFRLSIGQAVKCRPNLQPGDIRVCAEQALHEIAPFADEKQITVSNNLEPADRELSFEAGQIEQVLINILDNACRFTPRFGRIGIDGYPYFWERRTGSPAVPQKLERRRRTGCNFNSYRVDIVNSGTPIPDQWAERIFEEHTSYGGGSDRSSGGLGLAICRFIVHQHDGMIWAENSTNGPVFSFVLPALRSEPTSGIAGELEEMERVCL